MSQRRPEIRLGPRRGVPGASTERMKDAQGTLRRLGGYLSGQRWLLVGVVALVILATAFSLSVPYLVGVAIDQYIAVADVSGLMQIVILILVIAACYSAVTWVHLLLMNRVSQYTVRDLRCELFDKLQTLPLRFFDQRPHGELMSYLTNDVENISIVLAENVTTFLSSILITVGTVCLILLINIPLSIVTFIVIPTTAYFTRYVAKHTRKGFRDQQEALSQLNGQIEETITGGKIIRAYGQEQATVEDFIAKNERLREAAIYAQTYGGFMGPGNNMIYNFGFVLIASAGGWLALHDLASVGIIATFLTYTQQLRRQMGDITNMFNTIQSALAGAERIFTILDEQAEIENVSDAVVLETVKGAVRFEDVSFGYRPDVPILKHINLDVAPGKMIALVGPTGAGKTTIISLLSRFYDITSGTIRLDGYDIRRIDKYDLRRLLGIVLQDTFLFSETVMENIRYGRLDATDEEVVAAAQMANADHFVSRLPHGYQEMLSERASNLSQGQRQLLAIARAILADPAILILDEATSSVDTRTEIQVQQAMNRLMKGRTSFVIAHRLSTIRKADMILFIRDGEIAERGTHEELLALQGHYHQLYTSQFRANSTPAGD
ncbi:ABC transporter ATP-binding protein [Phototrophicus methaneseepsis]|uniref:ABC transporter ATP-binding protein n=1 Tax=Phototrophicus methaneseepsis TaxID=2710758 RepID=A0A7S8IGR1_9CHLR|nr:ABC transporter ATP-binding protein [Phototrophicus methaneseepsis]QPC84929.1 ABC transporter ATP-binding protein [Phototrophicus methaneseepsis]